MKKPLIIIISCVSILAAQGAWAQPVSLAVKQAVARDFDLLLADTVNEGDILASVKHNRGIPQMGCVLAPSRKNLNLELIKCQIVFKVTNTLAKPHRSCEESCFLIYVIQDRDVRSIKRGPDRLIDQCLERLSTTYCD